MTGRPALPKSRNAHLEVGPVTHAFYGRLGGVSEGIYASLNAGPGSGDDPDAVAENRARILADMGGDDLVSVHQVHGTDVAEVTAPWTERPRADAMVTKRPGLALCILTADCMPVLMADSQAGVVGAAHAGWKGALGGVMEACVDAMTGLGADPGRICAVIGPCIHQASYEVGPEFEDRFTGAEPANRRYFLAGSGDRRQFDLPGYAVGRLIASGVGAVHVLQEDTCALANTYFSNRRRVKEGRPDYGRNASVIMLRP